jgi:hypothetical protein
MARTKQTGRRSQTPEERYQEGMRQKHADLVQAELTRRRAETEAKALADAHALAAKEPDGVFKLTPVKKSEAALAQEQGIPFVPLLERNPVISSDDSSSTSTVATAAQTTSLSPSVRTGPQTPIAKQTRSGKAARASIKRALRAAQTNAAAAAAAEEGAHVSATCAFFQRLFFWGT